MSLTRVRRLEAIGGCHTSRVVPPRATHCSSSLKTHRAARLPYRSSHFTTRSTNETEVETTAPADVIPPGCARYEVALSKPLGMVLETDKSDNIFVAEIFPGGNAALSGRISVGDQLISTTGMMYTTGQTYGETYVRGGEQMVTMNVLGEPFDAVLAAISSHPAAIPVTLVFQQCD